MIYINLNSERSCEKVCRRKSMEHFEIFKACFPELELSEAVFNRLAKITPESLLEYREKGRLLGYAVAEKGNLRLLCVLPAYQKRGIGSRLLCQVEDQARQTGAENMTVGGGGSRLFPGMPDMARGFFEKNGYTVGGGYEEMKGDLTSFRAADYDLPVPTGVTFGWYHGPLEDLREAVAAVDETWVQYFGKDTPTFCATVGGEIASFCNVDVWENCLLSNGKNKVGAPGCVGTVPQFRKKGIGLKMVALACEELKKQGCDTCFIHYTGVGRWYARLGIETFLPWHFCEKRLRAE
ncbi:MAG: GNAT family N-acetyltransferase [Clostridia bacterium]|nr:GNAT family N-acetyltransferase [Clostridia bacterium]